jgi:hypothetical protein
VKTNAKRARDEANTARLAWLAARGVRIIPRGEVKVPAFVRAIRPLVIRTAAHTMRGGR